MTRILVRPELLHKMGKDFDLAAEEIREIEHRLNALLQQLSWEILQKTRVEEFWNGISVHITKTSYHLGEMSQFAHKKAEEFAQLDREEKEKEKEKEFLLARDAVRKPDDETIQTLIKKIDGRRTEIASAPTEKAPVEEPSGWEVAGAFFKGAGNAVADTVTDTWDGAVNLVTNPIETLGNMAENVEEMVVDTVEFGEELINDPESTVNSIVEGQKEKWNAFMALPADKQAEVLGGASVGVGSLLVGGAFSKGIMFGKAGKIYKADKAENNVPDKSSEPSDKKTSPSIGTVTGNGVMAQAIRKYVVVDFHEFRTVITEANKVRRLMIAELNKKMENMINNLQLFPYKLVPDGAPESTVIGKGDGDKKGGFFSLFTRGSENSSHGGEEGRKIDEEMGEIPKINSAKEVEIVNKRGESLGELDEVDLENKIFYEDKSAQGLNKVNPKTGLPAQTPQQFADKQILTKTRNRINALENATSTRATKNGSSEIPNLEDIKDIREFVFRLDGDTSELRQAVENSLNQLRKEFPDYKFNAIFGGK
ncbi:hypothetical protein [Brevibacillus daliensis]|uniref:hypothetical protein n=1 Tax=Brevibacillus daliensis TaxID=2892995 RepID=UPI001E50FB4D|nr:hypothetical protein [Brevibacillus daliensis]